MKRRNRKRGSKAARPAKIPVDAEKALGSSTALAGEGRQTHPGDEFIPPLAAKEPGSDPTTLPGADYAVELADQFATSVEEASVGWPDKGRVLESEQGHGSSFYRH